LINVSQEEVFPVADVPRRVRMVRRGVPALSASTAYRWVQRGRKGVRLEAIRIGGTLCTSMNALQAFFESCTRADSPAGSSPGPMAATPAAARQRAIEAADRELDRLGV
jgi:hypothetical protein